MWKSTLTVKAASAVDAGSYYCKGIWTEPKYAELTSDATTLTVVGRSSGAINPPLACLQKYWLTKLIKTVNSLLFSGFTDASMLKYAVVGATNIQFSTQYDGQQPLDVSWNDKNANP